MQDLTVFLPLYKGRDIAIVRLPSTKKQLFDFNAPGHWLEHVLRLHYMHVQLHNGYTQTLHANNATYAHVQGSDRTR